MPRVTGSVFYHSAMRRFTVFDPAGGKSHHPPLLEAVRALAKALKVEGKQCKVCLRVAS